MVYELPRTHTFHVCLNNACIPFAFSLEGPSRMPRFPKKAKGSAPPASAPVGPDAILEAVEDALERGEKKLRDREPAKAQKLFREALSQVQCQFDST